MVGQVWPTEPLASVWSPLRVIKARESRPGIRIEPSRVAEPGHALPGETFAHVELDRRGPHRRRHIPMLLGREALVPEHPREAPGGSLEIDGCPTLDRDPVPPASNQIVRIPQMFCTQRQEDPRPLGHGPAHLRQYFVELGSQPRRNIGNSAGSAAPAGGVGPQHHGLPLATATLDQQFTARLSLLNLHCGLPNRTVLDGCRGCLRPGLFEHENKTFNVVRRRAENLADPWLTQPEQGLHLGARGDLPIAAGD
jgi:hypothetical protein